MLNEKLSMPSVKQIQAIHVLKRKLGLDDEDYRRLLSSYGVTSSKYLSEKSAKNLIATLNALANGKSPDKYRKNRATDAQLRKIKAMWLERARSKSMRSLDRFIKHTTGIDHIEWLTIKDASRVIAGLKKLVPPSAESNE